MINSAVVDDKVFDSELDNYQISDLSDRYVYETYGNENAELAAINAAIRN